MPTVATESPRRSRILRAGIGAAPRAGIDPTNGHELSKEYAMTRLSLMVALPGLGAALVLGAARPADARITRIEITRVESPTFGGVSFGAVGTYDKLVGRAFGEVDPRDPRNAHIQDLELAPRNAHGMVEYAIDVYILTPHDPARGNATIFYDAVNRGNKVALGLF